MRVYHFVPRCYGMEDIVRRRLKIATLDQLNDPFELLAAAPRDPDQRAAFRRTKEQMGGRAGLLCFSRNWRNPVQWSHYADRHRGLCLGFDVADELVRPVIYRRHRTPFDPALLEDDDRASALMEELACTKFSHWRYKNEVRVFAALDERDQETGLFFAPFSPTMALREVIVGAAADVGRAELGEAVGGLSGQVRMRKARLAFRSFNVVTQRRRDQWQ